MKTHSLYWIIQTSGWFFYVLLTGLYTKFLLGFEINPEVAFSLILIFGLGIFYSHLYRLLILKFKWGKISPLKLMPIVIIVSIFFSILLSITQAGIEHYAFMRNSFLNYIFSYTMLGNILSIFFVFVVWSLIYFLIHYIENFRKSEIENLRWQTSVAEAELNRLKSQLNPHFIFNAMNSIRALVEESPQKAKDAISQLSNILRSTLLMDKKRLIPLAEEISLVKDYLNLESIRYEERLTVNFYIDTQCYTYEIPPMLLQTLVENGIKHGVSKLPTGGKIDITAKVSNGLTFITIINSGQLTTTEPDIGLGIKNATERLKLLLGDEASLSIKSMNNEFVLTELILPKS